MGDGSLSVPILVHKIIPTPPGLSWVSRDQKFSVGCKYTGFLFNFSVTSVNLRKNHLFEVLFACFRLFFEFFLQITKSIKREVDQETYIFAFYTKFLFSGYL